MIIRMLTEMIEYGHKIKEEVKALQNKIKQNTEGTNREVKETGNLIMIWNRRKKKTFNLIRMKKQVSKKTRRGLGTSGIILKVTTSES